MIFYEARVRFGTRVQVRVRVRDLENFLKSRMRVRWDSAIKKLLKIFLYSEFNIFI